MVDVGVGDKNIVDGVGGKGQLTIVDLIPTLLQAAVDQDPLAVYLQTVTTACDALIRAKETQLHERALLL